MHGCTHNVHTLVHGQTRTYGIILAETLSIIKRGYRLFPEWKLNLFWWTHICSKKIQISFMDPKSILWEQFLTARVL